MIHYLDRKMCLDAILKLKNFHDELFQLYENYGIDLNENIGRRNMMMSAAQEKFFSEVLSEKFTVFNNGLPGEPDIFLEDLNVELECKLTSRNVSGAINFQTDYDTLVKKQSLDYLYLVASRDFSEFSVLHYSGLTPDDFHPPANGSRGKSRMKTHLANKKVTPFVGSVSCINELNIKKLKDKMSSSKTKKGVEKIQKSLYYWQNTPNKYSISLEAV